LDWIFSRKPKKNVWDFATLHKRPMMEEITYFASSASIIPTSYFLVSSELIALSLAPATELNGHGLVSG